MPPPRIAPGTGPPVPIGLEAGWAPELVWTQRLTMYVYKLTTSRGIKAEDTYDNPHRSLTTTIVHAAEMI
jgi:hypothetical protein